MHVCNFYCWHFFPNKSPRRFISFFSYVKKKRKKSNEWRNEVSYTTLLYHWKVHWKLFIINSDERKLRFSPHFLSTACRSTYFFSFYSRGFSPQLPDETHKTRIKITSASQPGWPFCNDTFKSSVIYCQS